MKSWYFCLFLFPFLAVAQKSDLYLFNLEKTADSYELNEARLLSEFNPDGYTNQPFFISRDRLLVSAGPAGDPAGTDIYELNVKDRSYIRLTQTVDWEYSPQLFRDEFISCVVVEVENNNNQILWKYPKSLDHGGQRMLNTVHNVGYYCFLDNDWVAVFEVDSTNKLTLYNLESDDTEFVNDNVGRTLLKGPDGSLIYVHKHSDDYWFLKKKKPGSRAEIIKKTIPMAEDFTLLPDGTILMGKDNKLYCLDPAGDNLWKEIADLHHYGIQHITRLAYNGSDQLALVAQK